MNLGPFLKFVWVCFRRYPSKIIINGLLAWQRWEKKKNIKYDEKKKESFEFQAQILSEIIYEYYLKHFFKSI